MEEIRCRMQLLWMKIITIEEHYADQRIIDATAKYGDPSYMTALPDKVRGAYNHMRFTGEKLTDG